MRTSVLYLFFIFWTVTGLSNSEQNICKDGSIINTSASASYTSNSQSAIDYISNTLSYKKPSNSISTYATKSNNFTEEYIKLKNQGKNVIICQRFCKTNSLYFSDVQFCNPISTDEALYVLAFLCRLNV